MADLSFLDNLTKGALAALPAITGLVEQGGMSASQILATVRQQGFAIRTQTGLDVIGVLTDNVNAARAYRLAPGDVRVSSEFYGQAIGETLRNFSYQVKINGVEPGTGIKIIKNVTISSDEELSKEEILSKGQSFAATGKYGEFTVNSITITGALVSA